MASLVWATQWDPTAVCAHSVGGWRKRLCQGECDRCSLAFVYMCACDGCARGQQCSEDLVHGPRDTSHELLWFRLSPKLGG